ncbi:histidine phosphatase family protein [bacterium]|nr:histidine phosphatase family protein [bacterium]
MTETPSVFYVVRHGESHGNVQNVIQGHMNSPLTEAGERQAAELARSLRGVSFDLAFSSDLIRAHRTAEIVALEHQLAVNTNVLLREHNMGSAEGQDKERYREQNKELLERYEEASDLEKWAMKIPADSESDEETVVRLMTFLREAAVTYPGKTILVGTHGGVIRSLLVRLGYGTHAELPKGSVQNAGRVVVRTDGTDIEIVEVVGVTKNGPATV